MGNNMEGCLRAAGLATAAEHQSGDMLEKPQTEDPDMLERHASAAGRTMVRPGELGKVQPLPEVRPGC